MKLAKTEHKEFSKYLAPNMVTNIVRTVLAALIGLFLVPYFISEMGSAVYAMLPLATSVTAYVLVVSDEITNAFSRYLVISIHGNDNNEASRVYTTTIFGLGKMVLVATPIMLIISYLSPYVFQIGPSSAVSVQLMFLMILSSAIMISFSACFNSIYVAFNKMYLLYSIRIVYILLQVAMIIGFFSIFGPSLEMIGLAYLISGVIFFIMIWVSSKRLYPLLRVDRSLYNRHLLKDIGNIGIWTVLNKLGLLMFIQSSMIVVNLLMGATEQTGFAIVANLISMTNTACITITTVIAPFLYLNYANGNRENLIKISRVSMKSVGLFIAFPIAYLCIFPTQILTAWVGEQFTYLSDIIIIMFMAQLAVCIMSTLEVIPILYLKMRSIAMFTLFIGALNVVFAVAAISFTDIGIIGVGIVWTIAMLVLNLFIYPYAIAKMTSSKWTTFLTPMIPGHIALALCIIFGSIATMFFDLPSTWSAVLVTFFIVYGVYLIAALSLGLTREDKSMIRGVIPEAVARRIPRWIL